MALILPSCTDVLQNGQETDVDCGGPCPVCGDGKKCSAGKDCASGICNGGLCQGSLCTDLAKNGTETDVDCGGASCPGCADGKACVAATDCAGSAARSALRRWSTSGITRSAMRRLWGRPQDLPTRGAGVAPEAPCC